MPVYDAELVALRTRLEEVYRTAWREVTDLQRQVAEGMLTNPRLWRQRDRLAEMRQRIEHTIAGVDGIAHEWVTRELPQFYEAGADAAAAALGNPFGWTQAHIDAVILLGRDTFDDLLAATAHVAADTKRFIRDVAKARAEVGTVVGRTATQTAREVEKLLRAKGITAVTYANGARVGLDTYTQMALRTKTAVAYNAGTINHSAAQGVKFYEIFDGPECGLIGHSDPDLANGKIVDASDAATYVISHPNCARSFGPRPDIADKGQLKKAEPTAGGQAADRPEAAQFPLEAAARTGAARQAATARRVEAGLVNKAHTPAAVLQRRATMIQNTLQARHKFAGNAVRRARASRQRAEQRTVAPVPAAGDPLGAAPEGFRSFSDVMRDARAKPGSTQHVPFDGGAIEGLDVRATKVTIDGDSFTELQFKLTEDAKQKLLAKARGTGGVDEFAAREAGKRAYQQAINEGKTTYEAGQLGRAAEQKAIQGTSPWAKRQLELPKRRGLAMDFDDPAFSYTYRDRAATFTHTTSDGTIIRFNVVTAPGSDTPYAFDGLVQAWVPGDLTPRGLKGVMDAVGVGAVRYPLAAEVRAYVENAVAELFRVGRGTALTDQARQTALEGAKRVFGLNIEDVQLRPGLFGRVEVHLPPAVVRNIVDKTGARFFTHSFSHSDVDTLANIIESGQLASTTIRWTEGIGRGGMSSATDVRTGGADYMFTRQVTDNAGGYGTRIVFDGERLLTRTDWFAYPSDTYGAQNPLGNHASSVRNRDNLRNLGQGARGGSGGQETMFKHRLAVEDAANLYTDASTRDALIRELTRRGVTKVGGKRLEDFIKVARSY